ncbi:MAG: hypothetical protein FJY88_06130 [Candidatus Eisenbacteria bacterium]|nr:hypothetical protein [Candidatus Eisenbacteria bacterium]
MMLGRLVVQSNCLLRMLGCLVGLLILDQEDLSQRDVRPGVSRIRLQAVLEKLLGGLVVSLENELQRPLDGRCLICGRDLRGEEDERSSRQEERGATPGVKRARATGSPAGRHEASFR